jgi:hypothetical protein
VTTATEGRTAKQMRRYSTVKRANYWFEHYGKHRQRFWRVGLKRLSASIHERIRYEETKRQPFFVYDVRNHKRTPLRSMGNLSEADIWGLIPSEEITSQVLKDVDAGKRPAGSYLSKDGRTELPFHWPDKYKRPRLPRGFVQGAYLQPRTGEHPRKKKYKPLVEETLGEFKAKLYGQTVTKPSPSPSPALEPVAGHQELTAEQHTRLLAALRETQGNPLQPATCPMCGARKYAALQKDGLTLKCFKCKQSCSVDVEEAKEAGL